jgi:hypothetical protein
LASIHLRAVARNSASCGVSSKFMADSFLFVIPGRAQREPGISIHIFWIPGLRLAAHPGMTIR